MAAKMTARQRAPHMRRLWEWQNGQCAHCRCGMPHPDRRRETDAPVLGHAPTIEHFQPSSLGGVNALENLLLVCSACNFRRGARAPSRNLKEMKRRLEPVIAAWRAAGFREEAA